MTTNLIILTIGFFVVAIIYSSVGFGGGSSYLALLALLFASTALSYQHIRATALICNIVVVTGGTYIFYKEHLLDFRKGLPFILASIPLAYIGGRLPIGRHEFFILLGFTLVVSSLFLFFQPTRSTRPKSDNLILNGSIGGAIGFISGMVGIGGGIFLSPTLHFMRWDEARKISGMASFFILVNSISGLIGQLQADANLEWRFVLPLAIAVLMGGQIGSRLGAQVFNPVYVKRITAILIFAVGSKILYDNLL